jgi:hypothetical protein
MTTRHKIYVVRGFTNSKGENTKVYNHSQTQFLTDSLQYILKLSHSAKNRAWDTGAPFVEHRERYTPREREAQQKNRKSL